MLVKRRQARKPKIFPLYLDTLVRARQLSPAARASVAGSTAGSPVGRQVEGVGRCAVDAFLGLRSLSAPLTASLPGTVAMATAAERGACQG